MYALQRMNGRMFKRRFQGTVFRVRLRSSGSAWNSIGTGKKLTMHFIIND